MLIEVIIIFLLIILNGIFSMSEMAVVSSKKFRLETEAEKGNRGAKKALDLTESPGRFLSTVQVGITLIGILTGVFGGASTADQITAYLIGAGLTQQAAKTVAVTLVVIGITYFSLIIGELVPKRLALHNPEKIASALARPMSFLAKLTSPLIWLLNSSSELFIKLLGIKPKDEDFVTEEEIRAMLEEASDAGEVEKEEREMVERVFFLGDTNVGSLMTSRHDMVCVDINDDLMENYQVMSESIHTHFPVFEDNQDNIIGVLSIKKLSSALMKGENVNLKGMLDKALFVPEQMTAFRLLENMKKYNTHFALAVDEYGTIKGLVTSNDLFKVLAGDIETEQEDGEIVEREDGTFLVDGLISLDEFFEYFEIEDTEEIEGKGFYTLGGFVLYITDHIPATAECFKWRQFEFEIVDMDGARVDKVLVKPPK
jgi:putative hemolysin